MNRRGLLLLWGVLALFAHLVAPLLPAQRVSADPPTESARTLAYRIDARLDAKTYQIACEGTLAWANQTDEPVTEMRLHLYLNAFKNDLSTFMRESKGSHRGNKVDPRNRGWIDLLSFKRKDGEELFDPNNAKFWHGDDGNTDDQTVVVIALKEEIPAHGTATFELSWNSQMPRVFARTGFGGNGAFFMVAQWFPKPGVWQKESVDGEEKCVWNCHQFHGSSEFYADYGSYDVSITLPAQFEEKLGASGERVDLGDASTPHKGRRNEDGSITYRHKVDHVHDFAWVCGEEYDIHEIPFEGGAGTAPDERDRVAKILGRKPSDLDLPPVTCYFLLQPEHADQLERHKKAVFHALTYMGFWFGPYPYPTLTVVDPDHRGRDAGGMEYPTLITGGTRYIRAARQLSPEGVLVHEFGHQHFYGLVGTNEFRHAWMDEGMNTWATAKVLMTAPDYDGYAGATWYGGFPHYGERPFKFRGLAAESRGDALPLVGYLFDDKWKVPFGSLGIVKSMAGLFGSNHPPKKISLWPQYGEVTPLSFLREVPTLTHMHTLPSTGKEHGRASSAATPVTDPIAGRRAWQYMNRRSYGTNSYRRPASSLRTMEGYLGEETVVRIMRTYCERYRFQHPEPKDFYAVVNEVTRSEGKGDVQWLLDALFESDEGIDFGIGSVETHEAPKPNEDKTKAKEKEKDDPEVHESTVLLRRFEGGRLPVDVRVRFADGTTREFRWGLDDSLREWKLTDDLEQESLGEPIGTHDVGLHRLAPARGLQGRWAKLHFRGPSKVTSAETDPRYLNGLDRDRTNDGRTKERNAGASLQLALRALGWVQMSNAFYGGL